MFNFCKNKKTVAIEKITPRDGIYSKNLHAIFADTEKIHICGSNACKYHDLFQ